MEVIAGGCLLEVGKMNPQKKTFEKPDDVKKTPSQKTEFLDFGGRKIARATYEPGWQWSKNMKPLVGTKSCQMHHLAYAIKGKLRVRMDDGTEMEFGPGDLVDIPPGHDGWVVGSEPVLWLDLSEPPKSK